MIDLRYPDDSKVRRHLKESLQEVVMLTYSNPSIPLKTVKDLIIDFMSHHLDKGRVRSILEKMYDCRKYMPQLNKEIEMYIMCTWHPNVMQRICQRYDRDEETVRRSMEDAPQFQKSLLEAIKSFPRTVDEIRDRTMETYKEHYVQAIEAVDMQAICSKCVKRAREDDQTVDAARSPSRARH